MVVVKENFLCIWHSSGLHGAAKQEKLMAIQVKMVTTCRSRPPLGCLHQVAPMAARSAGILKAFVCGAPCRGSEHAEYLPEVVPWRAPETQGHGPPHLKGFSHFPREMVTRLYSVALVWKLQNEFRAPGPQPSPGPPHWFGPLLFMWNSRGYRTSSSPSFLLSSDSGLTVLPTCGSRWLKQITYLRKEKKVVKSMPRIPLCKLTPVLGWCRIWCLKRLSENSSERGRLRKKKGTLRGQVDHQKEQPSTQALCEPESGTGSAALRLTLAWLQHQAC